MHQSLRIVSIIMTILLLSAPAYAAKGVKQTYFASPEEAVKAFAQSIKENNTKQLVQILGPQSKKLVESGDAIEDKANREKFINAYDENNKLEKINDTKMVLTIGKDNFVFPIPLVQESQGWYFDTTDGKEEILNRRIGRNELSAIQAILAYVDAQREYYLHNPQQAKTSQYAQKFISSEDKRDGLYYPVKAGETPSPLGEIYAKAQAQGYGKKASNSPQPYLGYYYRILTSQGKDAPGNEYDYIVNGKMIGGHALIAWPATYGNSGIMTFMVNQEGKVYQKDLGKDTKEAAKKITKFNPDNTWTVVKEEK